jgi:hypothetical protein
MTTANINVRQILLKRGNTSVSAGYVGPLGEVTLDTTLKSLRIHDGVTPGGNIVVKTASASGDPLAGGNANGIMYVDANLNIQSGNANVGPWWDGQYFAIGPQDWSNAYAYLGLNDAGFGNTTLGMTANNDALIWLTAGGTGDAVINLNSPNGTVFSTGLDSSDNDALVFSFGWPLGTNNAVRIGTDLSTNFYGLVELADALKVAEYVELTESVAPPAPQANNARIYAEDNGSGKTRIMVKFSDGSTAQLAIQP